MSLEGIGHEFSIPLDKEAGVAMQRWLAAPSHRDHVTVIYPDGSTCVLFCDPMVRRSKLCRTALSVGMFVDPCMVAP